MSLQNPITLIGAGGAGSNIVHAVDMGQRDPTPGFPLMKVAYIDTSKSNMIAKDISPEQVYVLEGKDGSGKVRRSNFPDIEKQALAMLQKFKPTGLTIIVHSGAGGSGSVIAPVLVSELMKQDKPVIVLMVGSTDTLVEIENMINTLKSYEGIAQKRDKPVVLHYIENSDDQMRSRVNKEMVETISFLCGLFSGSNEELDSADLANWMNYLSFSKTDAQLTSLNVVTRPEDMDKVGTVVSVATLAIPGMPTKFVPKPAYQGVGFVPEIWYTGKTRLIGDHPIHFTISEDFIEGAVKSLLREQKEINESMNSRVARTSILGKNDNATDSGLVL